MANSNVVSITTPIQTSATITFARTVDNNVSMVINLSLPANAYVPPYDQYNDNAQTVFTVGAYQIVSPQFSVANPTDNQTNLTISGAIYSKRPRTGGAEETMAKILEEIKDEQIKLKIKHMLQQFLMK